MGSTKALMIKGTHPADCHILCSKDEISMIAPSPHVPVIDMRPLSDLHRAEPHRQATSRIRPQQQLHCPQLPIFKALGGFPPLQHKLGG